MRKDILSLTIKEAIRLAEMYEDDIYWDIWEYEQEIPSWITVLL